jgi:hypothetical protein
METKNLATRYGLPALEWATIRRDLDAGAIEASGGTRPNTCWLTTVGDDGAPPTPTVLGPSGTTGRSGS